MTGRWGVGYEHVPPSPSPSQFPEPCVPPCLFLFLEISIDTSPAETLIFLSVFSIIPNL